ncbi:MAG: Sip1-related alpha-galactosidase [Ignisphaera sp.]
MDFPLKISNASIIYADGSKEECSLVESNAKRELLKCEGATIEIAFEGGLIGVEVKSLKPLNSFIFAEIGLEIGFSDRVLALTLHPDAASIYSQAFAYYNLLAVDRTPTTPRPSDAPQYPPSFGDITHIEFAKRSPCWTYPVIVNANSIPSYTVFVLGDIGGDFIAVLLLSNGDVTAYMGRGLKVSLFLGKERLYVRRSWIMSIGISSNPYEAIRKSVEYASRKAVLKTREMKRRPLFIDKLGWCSWNALLTDDLSHDNVIKIVKGLIDRGVPIRWVIIDDGWQKEVRKGGEWFMRVLADLNANERFPNGLKAVVDELKRLGIEYAGLWHTINIHWGGFEKQVSEKIGVEGFKLPIIDSFVPPPQIERALKFYTEFLKWVKGNGFDFVKVDNQWSIHALYWGEETVGESAKNIQIALQVAAKINGLDILNCMSMAPEDYSNYFLSNAMRVSIDYIPFWKADAKLHTMFSVYNSLLFSHIAYPDYDMWISYDPYATIHAVSRVFSGGPIYITDRHPEKTNIDLLKKIVLPSGETVKVDEPGLPTKDILFRDPYNENVLLKIASRIRDSYVLAIMNVNRDGIEIEERVGLDVLPYSIADGRYVYYMVFSGKRGVIDRSERVDIKLKELEAEVVVFTPIENEKAVIGLKEYVLPPYPIMIYKLGNRVFVKAKTFGTLVYYANGVFKEAIVGEGQVLEM